MFAFGESFFRASRLNRIVCHFNVFANVFFIRFDFVAGNKSTR